MGLRIFIQVLLLRRVRLHVLTCGLRLDPVFNGLSGILLLPCLEIRPGLRVEKVRRLRITFGDF